MLSIVNKSEVQRKIERMSVFYESYGKTKAYETPSLNAKHISKFDQEVWKPAQLSKTMSCLEIGCGTGHFLSYLHHKGVQNLKAIDLDPTLGDVIPANVREYFEASDVFDFLDPAKSQNTYDRIFMFDVFEHFSAQDGHDLLLKLKSILSPGGQIVLKMPNASSPWGLQFQFGDLTHITGYSPDSIRQMADSVGMVCSACHPHTLGSRNRQFRDRFVQAVLNRMISTPPEIWEGNFYAILHDQ